ncbi:MAG: hypothetical protein KBT47_04765 [Armatimonadetes bacterium]|nr:hypothetical protein [Candidatus Hippobium faecium]
MKAYTSGLIINQNTKITKERRLPIKGTVLCKKGDRVEYNTTIARGEIKGHLATFRFSQEMNINPPDTEKFLIPKTGDKIAAGDIIGSADSFFGLFHRHIKSPYSGTLEYINKDTGTIGIRLDSSVIDLKAYIRGTVKEIIPDEGAVIETQGTYIQGIFGIGGEKYGKLIFNPNETSDTNENYILVSTENLTCDTLKEYEKRNIVGVIAGSVSDTEIAKYTEKELGVAITGDEKCRITLILTEGFGNIPISDRTLKILKNIENSYISVNGATQIRAGVIRPEIIKSSDNSENTVLNNNTSLRIGSQIRIMSEPYLCRYGTVTKIFDKPIQLETGTFANCIEAKIDNRIVIIPRTNIEIIY